MRLIDADVADKWMQQNNAFIDSAILKAIPTIDAVPVVRCRECRHSSLPSGFTQRYGEPGTLSCHFGPCNRRNVNGNDFCSYGQRKIETVLPINCTKDEGLEDEHEVS